MMNRALRFIELLWLGVAAVSSVEIYVNWGSNWQSTIKFSLFLGAAIFMYVFPQEAFASETT